MIAGTMLGLSVFLTDHHIKKYVEENREIFERKHPFDKVLRLELIHNQGVAGEFLSDHPQGALWGSLAALCLLTSYGVMAEQREKNLLRELGIGLMAGGGLENWIDRKKQGEVTDYLRFPMLPGKLKKLVYNFSDLAIFAGAVLLVVSEKNE